jgi:hypothetical protein
MAIPGVDNAASQQLNISVSQGAINFAPKAAADRERETDRTTGRKSAGEMNIADLEAKGRKGELAQEIMTPLLDKLAEVGITIGSRNGKGKQSEAELKTLVGRDESYEDTVSLKSDSPVITEVKRLKQQQERESDQGFGRGRTADEVLALLKEYAALFAESLAGQNPRLFDRLKELKEKLLQAGLAEEKLAQLESGLRTGQQADPGEALKDGILLQAMADGLIERSVRDRGLRAILSGIKPGERDALADKAKEKAKSELKGFVLEELENTMIRKTYLQDHDHSEVLQLIRLGGKAGLDSMQWLGEMWAKKKDDHGLYLIDVPPAATGLTVNTTTDNPTGNQAPRHGYEYEKEDENEVLLNRLRALYMQKALKGDAFVSLQTEFKIRKMKNGLFKLGVLTKDLDEQVKHEAELVAKLKIVDMLKEALVERASFYQLSGPAHELTERKIKGLLKNAERLGLPMASEDFNQLRDHANRRVFTLSVRELEEVRNQRAVKDDKKLEQKDKFLVRLLTRLKGETDIAEEIPAAYASFS